MKENLMKIEDLSAMTREKIVEILDIILYHFEMILVTDENVENRTFMDTHFDERKYEYLSFGDIRRTGEILENHFGNLGFKFKIIQIDRIVPEASWKNLHREIKNFREVVYGKKTPMTGETIVELMVVKPDQESNKYQIIVNQKFNKPIEADRATSSWKFLFDLAISKRIPYTDTHKTNIDYFNSNKKCKLYTQTGLSITKIFQRDSRFVKALIPIEVITQKAYKQKLNS